MASVFHLLALAVTSTLAVGSLVYVAGCVVLSAAWRRRKERWPVSSMPVAILKPLCGAEPGLEENLRSFCSECGPDTEIFFGARDADDPALVVARRVVADYPGLDARFVAGAPVLGLNAKINTVARLAALARHDVLVLADSDAHIGPGDLVRTVAPLRDPTVGVVSCVFRGQPTDTFWSRLGALSIDEWFMPSVLVSRAVGSAAYCSGPLMAIRREVLDAIGGFAPLAAMLADDNALGARVRQLGYRSEIADCEVTAVVNERTLGDLIRHELRWMRTIRTVAPVGHSLSVLMYALPLTLIAAAVAGLTPWSLGLVAGAIALRATVHLVVSRPSQEYAFARRPALWMVFLRDIASFGLWVASYASRTITWRGRTMWVGADGILRPATGRRGRTAPGATEQHTPEPPPLTRQDAA